VPKRLSAVEQLSLQERITAAKVKTARLVDHLVYLLALHENNAIVLYSEILSKQIPRSFAANAFNVFRSGLHQFEIVRLCALWDGFDMSKENIPTVVELIDHHDVFESLAQEASTPWRGMGGAHEALGNHRGQEALRELRQAVRVSRAVCRSPRLKRTMNLRHKHLAHSLSQTYSERAGPVARMRHGDERRVLHASLPIVQALYRWVNGTSFSFEQSREIGRKNARALWEACTFNIAARQRPNRC
jgi:hypothetical protein